LEVAVWNKQAVNLQPYVHVGDIIHIEGYKIKRDSTKPEGIEISVNTFNPIGIISILSCKFDTHNNNITI